MNWLDLIIILCIGIGVIKGLFDGFVKQVISLIALVLSVLFAGYLASSLQGFIGGLELVPDYLCYPLSYVLSFVLIFGLMGLLGRFLQQAIEWSFLGCMNNLAGGFVGMLISVVGLSLLFNFLIIFDRNSRLIGKQTKRESVLFSSVQQVVPALYPYIKHKVEEGLGYDPFFEGDDSREEAVPERKEPEPMERPSEKKAPKKKSKDIFEI